MDKQRIVKILYPNREEVRPVYANNTSVMFNPFEFNIEFAHIDGIAATEKIQAGGKEITARCVAKVVLSHQAMLDLQRTINQSIEQFSLQFGKETER